MRSFEEYLQQIEPDLKKKANSYWYNWQLKGMGWEDVAQQLRIQLWKKFPQFDKTKASFRTWANKVMLNKIKDIARLSQTKQARILNEAISTEELLEKGLDINDENEIVRQGD